MKSRKKVKGPKRVSYELIDPKNVIGQPIYKLLRELVREHHDHLVDARIALAWCTSWRPDVDGRCILGKCKKASDLDRELASFDFIILLKKSWWQDVRDVTNETTGEVITAADQRKALLDHELCHAGVKLDDRTNEVVRDERGRKVYRTVRHDIEEFSSVVARNGIWRHDIEQFAAAVIRSHRQPWQPCAKCNGDTPGFVEVEDVTGVKRLQKCECRSVHAERLAAAS